MEQNDKTINQTPEEMDASLEADFSSFVKENVFTPQDVREAYYRFCGVSDSQNTGDRLSVLVEKIKELTGKGLPMNRFTKHMEVKGSEKNMNAWKNSCWRI